MKTVMAVLVVLPALMASALPVRAQSAGAATLKPAMTLAPRIPCGDRHPIQPLNGGGDRLPYGPDVPCPEVPGPTIPGPEPLPYPGPRHPRPWEDQIRASAATFGAVKGGEHGAVLAAMFDGSGFRGGKDASAVFVGGMGRAGYRIAPSNGTRIVLVGEKGATAGAILGGAAGELAGPGGSSLGAGAGGLAGSKTEDAFNKWIDDKGNKAIEEGEKKLKEGTDRQRAAEREFKNKR